MRCYRKTLHISYKDHVTNEEVRAKMIIIKMEISTAPYLLKILQPKARTNAIQTTITSHRHTRTHRHTRARTHTHAHSHTSSFKNYMPPKYTCQKAENQTIGASFALSLSLSTRSHTGAGHLQFYRRKSRVSSWTHRKVLRVWFVHWAE